VELEADGQFAPAVVKTRGKPYKRPEKRRNAACLFSIVKSGGFLYSM